MGAARVVGVTDLKRDLLEELRKVQRGERVVVTRRGRPVAALVPLRDVRYHLVEQAPALIRDWVNQAGDPT